MPLTTFARFDQPAVQHQKDLAQADGQLSAQHPRKRHRATPSDRCQKRAPFLDGRSHQELPTRLDLRANATDTEEVHR